MVLKAHKVDSIKVSAGRDSFFVMISKNLFPAYQACPEKFLGLKKWYFQADMKGLPGL